MVHIPISSLYKLSILLIHFFTFNSTQDIKDQCRICRSLVKTFMAGLDKTVKLHFGGGNTDWEEKKLGKFRTSETCFVEVMEHICIGEEKETRFKCQSMAEKQEELLEKWFFEHQEEGPSLEAFLCNENLNYCCDQGYYGPNCALCPGMKASGQPCFGRGGCDGSGTRKGDGTCSCWPGYVGKMCSNCDSNYFPVEQNSTFIKCSVCFDGCAGGCVADGPKGCKACRSGYSMDEEMGCRDVDECAENEKCTKSNELCVNTQGSFECKCADGFKRSDLGDCEFDVEADPSIPWLGPVQLLRFCAYSALSMVSLFIFSMHRSALTISLNVLTILLVLLIDFYYDGGIGTMLRGRHGREEIRI